MVLSILSSRLFKKTKNLNAYFFLRKGTHSNETLRKLNQEPQDFELPDQEKINGRNVHKTCQDFHRFRLS